MNNSFFIIIIYLFFKASLIRPGHPQRQTDSKTPHCCRVACHSCSALSRPGFGGEQRTAKPRCHRLGSMARRREDEVTWPTGGGRKGDIGWSAAAGQTVGTGSPSWKGGPAWPEPGGPELWIKADHSRWRSCCFQLIGDCRGCQFCSEGRSRWLLKKMPDDVIMWFAASPLFCAERQQCWRKRPHSLFKKKSWLIHEKVLH